MRHIQWGLTLEFRAYLEAVKYEVLQGKGEKIEFERHAREEGLTEAEISRLKYESMRRDK